MPSSFHWSGRVICIWFEHLFVYAQMLHSLDHWKEPTETNEVLLIKYAASIRSGTITSQRNPVLFEIATHHITHYVERNPHALDKLNL